MWTLGYSGLPNPGVTLTWQLNDQEFRTVVALPSPRRYAYAIKRLADWGEVWSLRNEDGWVLASDDSGHEAVPIWPHPRYAEASAVGEWIGTKPSPIEIHQFVDRWIPGMIRDSRLVTVFPAFPLMKGVVVAPERLKEDLQAELARME